VKTSLSGFILNDRRTARKLARIFLDDKGRSLPADVALDVLIQEYVNLRLGGSSDIVSESKFPNREFTLEIPNNGPALIQRSKNLSHLEVTMPAHGEEVAQ
jgi:hypothetical protein